MSRAKPTPRRENRHARPKIDRRGPQGRDPGGIGFCILVLLAIKLVGLVFLGLGGDVSTSPPLLFWLFHANPLEIVAGALAFSAGVELAYMLFTPGPDEAVQPLILGIAAAALLAASREPMDLCAALTIAVLTVAIGLLFYVRKTFADPKEPPPFRTSLGHLLRRARAVVRRFTEK